MIADHPAAQDFQFRPEYLDTSSGRIFVLFVIPRQATRPVGGVIALPPFAEEMNKSRHMLAMLGQRLASMGIVFALPDLYGTGDSEGEFSEATWGHWLSNVRATVEAVSDYGITGLNFVALRLGIFLLPDLQGSRFADRSKVVMWNPVQRGSKMIDQMLRAKVIRERESADEGGTIATLRKEIRGAGGMEVAGYRLTDALVSSVDGLELSKVQMPVNSEVEWIDTSPIGTDRVAPAVEVIKSAWSGRIRSLAYSRIVGQQFWMGPEIDLVPDLISRTTAILASA